MTKPVTSSNWDDLRPRLVTGAVMIVVGVIAIWLGGPVFAIGVALVTAVMIWELSRMIAADKTAEAIQLAVLTAAVLLVARAVPAIYLVPLMLAPAVMGAYILRAHVTIYVLFALGIVIAGYGLTLFREIHGVVWLFWLVIVVAATDIAGYFGGKLIGGRKFWPSVSPKKTWSGILSGWGAAAVIGVVFLMITDAGRDLIWISVLLSFASQMGDMAESAVKRKMGVKDSSNLLPGHGGLFDRFDGLLGAALFMLLVALVVDVPVLRF